MPSGNVTSSDFRLFSRAPRTTSACPLPLRRFAGVAIERLPEKNCPVGDALHSSTSAIVPCTTTSPPWTPGPGPISTMWSAARMVSSSCSTTMTVLPMSRSRSMRRDHLDVVLGMQADARLVEDVEHPHQAGADLRREPDALRFAARERAGAAIEIQVVEADAEQQLEPRPNLLQHLASGIGAAPCRLDRPEKRVQFVEVQLADVVDRLAADGEEQAGRAQPRAVAVRARLLDHDLVEPLLHPRVHFAALAVAAVVTLDPPCDAAGSRPPVLHDRRASPSRPAAAAS